MLMLMLTLEWNLSTLPHETAAVTTPAALRSTLVLLAAAFPGVWIGAQRN
jgi:hypothetical protein